MLTDPANHGDRVCFRDVSVVTGLKRFCEQRKKYGDGVVTGLDEDG